MRYDIMINLDYEAYPHEQVKQLFRELQHAMQQAGFIMDGRLFSIDLPPGEAQALARSVIAEIEEQYHQQGQSIYPLFRECFGFEPEHTANLLLPPTEDIDVEELADIEGVEVFEISR
jgi:hypothetical protein